MPWKKQISNGKWLPKNSNDDESLHNLISPNNYVSSSSNNADDVVLSKSMQMMSLSSPGTITNILHGVKPSTVDNADDNSLELDAETVTEESKGCVENDTSNNKEMRLIRRISLSSDSDSSISSSSNESTTAIIYETLDDIICRIENKEFTQHFMVQMQKNKEKQQQLDQDEIEDDSHNSGELTKSCNSGDGSIDQECSSSSQMISSPSGNFHVPESALNTFLSSPSPTNWESLVTSMKHRSQSPWGDGEFAVINVEKNREEEGSVVSDFDDSIEENKYAFINKYLKQQVDDNDMEKASPDHIEVTPSDGCDKEKIESFAAAGEEEPPLETAADPENDEAQVGVEAATNNEEAADESSPNIEDDTVHTEASSVGESSASSIDEEGSSYKKLTKRDTIYQSISTCKMKMKSFTRQCRGSKKGSYSKIPTSDIHLGGFHENTSIERLQVPSSVTIIDDYAYNSCPNLTDAVLSDGIQEIRNYAFAVCRSLEHINIPSTLSSLREGVFAGTKISSIDLPDSINNIGARCFSGCRHLTNIRIPPLVKDLPRGGYSYNSIMFSVEIPENINHFDITCFEGCYSLRNVAFPPSAILSGEPIAPNSATRYYGARYEGYTNQDDAFLWHILHHCKDLFEVYQSTPPQFKLQPIRKALMNRFDGLPIHEILYYQSYYSLETVLKRLDEAMNQKRRSRVLSTTYQGLLGVDWLGMTPLHILACSKRQSLDLYQVIIERYPQNLITKDKFGAEPLLYAIWGSAPTHILSFLAESYRSKHPDYELDWYGMIKTLSIGHSTRVLHKLFDTQETYFPEQKIRRWKSLIDEIAGSGSAEVFKFSSRLIITSRLDCIGMKRMAVIYKQIDAIPDASYGFERKVVYLPPIRANLDIYEHDYQVLKEVAPLLELAVWKIKVDNKGATTSLSRRVCRYNCGADIVIGHVLPFLLYEDL